MSRTKTKTKTKTPRPLTISIHGDGLDIEAKFADSHLGDVLADTIRRVGSITTPPIVETPPAPATPLGALVSEFGKALTKEQIDVLMSALSAEQKMLFMEIMTSATTSTAAGTTSETTTPPKPEHDFDVVGRVIEHADQAVLRAIVDLAKDAIARHDHAS